jgi:histidinol-phosphate aminotransferase
VTALPPPRDDLGLREGYHSPQVDVPIRLNTNESPFPPPAGWTEAVLDEMRNLRWNRYPDRDAVELRQALADLHEVDPEQVFCANGSNEVLQCLCLAYGGPGRSVVVFEPTYALHSHIAHLTGTEVIEGDRRPDFSLDTNLAKDLIGTHRPTLTFLCSPNNPTGTGMPCSVVGEVISVAPGLVVVDEAYGQFADWSAISRVEESTPLVVTRTFSKTWSMAAARLGYLVAPTEVVTTLQRVALPYHLDAFKQIAGRLALNYVSEMEERVHLIVRERERIVAAFTHLPVTTWPSQANFVLLRPETRKGGEVWSALVERGILVRDVSSWPGLGGCLRLTIGTPEENDAFLAALTEVL